LSPFISYKENQGAVNTALYDFKKMKILPFKQLLTFFQSVVQTHQENDIFLIFYFTFDPSPVCQQAMTLCV
jgi:hypothetical protein